MRQGKLDAAIEAHEKAANLIGTAMTLTDLNAVQQSLLCQKEYHIRQVWLLQSKIAALDKYLKRKMNSGGEEHRKDSTISCMDSQQETQQKLKVTQMEIMRCVAVLNSKIGCLDHSKLLINLIASLPELCQKQTWHFICMLTVAPVWIRI